MDIDWLTEVDFKASSVSHQSVNPRFRYDNNTLSKVHDSHLTYYSAPRFDY